MNTTNNPELLSDSVSCESLSSESEKTPWTDSLSEEDIVEIENITYELIGEYINSELETMYSPYFNDKMVSDITEIIEEQLLQLGIYSKDNYDELESFVTNLCDNFFANNINIPPRSYNKSFIVAKLTEQEKEQLQTKLNALQNVVQTKQKTEEWYKCRKNIITASNIWKVFGTECQQNSLIYDKCSPYNENEGDQFIGNNVNSSVHWGNKYEPLSVMLYEKLYDTKIQEFGCIIHPKYSFIGASPDGINVDITNDRYGRMIEIKNIVNRDITGIPKMEYWIQMQLQMETCDLEECDFIETRFKEFENKNEFYEHAGVYEHRGVVLYFTPAITEMGQISYTPYYVFMPLDIPLDEPSINRWIEEKKTELEEKYTLFRTDYWYLDEISVVLVKRNREWFQCVVPKIQELWAVIEKERVEGYEHRNTKRSKTKVVSDVNSTNKIISNMKNTLGVPLIKLDELDLDM